jgi:predicted ATPase/transcriptional regulator with XRE-family HTH domain
MMSSPFGEMLRAFRVRAGMSQEALAEASGVSVRTISDLERGQRPSAHLETVRLLASALDLSSDERRRLIESARPVGPVSASSSRTRIGESRWSASIPAPATPLVGRASELDELVAALGARTGEIVTLTGPGGVGKTRLAIEVAHRLAPAYADGAAFVELATVTQAELVPDAIARALGMNPRATAGADQLTALLATREVLLILDNVEQVIEAASFIAQLDAACPHLTVLVTSRARLRVSNEWELAVPPLSLAGPKAPLEELRASDAIQLFAERGRRVDPRFELTDRNIATVAEICQRLDGLPLAIELAASRLRVLSVASLSERLDRRLPLLTGGDRDRPPRQQSMRETIAWSYDLLKPIEQQFLRWMAVFAGGLSLDAAEALGHALGLDQDESLEAVTTLVESGLAARSGPSSGQPRFHLFETIREFALEQLAEASELDAARLFHATHFLEFASQDAPRPDEPIPIAWVGRLAPEYPNLLAAFDYLCIPETAEQSLRFAAAMGPYWHSRGPFSDWLPRLSRAFDLASSEPTVVKVHLLNWLTLVLGPSPDFSKALHVANRGIEMADEVGTTSDRAAALHILAWVHECHEHWATARELRDQASELWKSVGNTYMHAMCLAMNATSAYALGDLDRAQRESEQSVSIFRALGALDWSASTACSQGTFAVAGGRLDLGAAYYEQSLRTWMQTESASRWYRPLVGLADIAAALGQPEVAARLIGAADEMLIVSGRDLPFFDRPGYARAETRCREALGSADFEESRRAGSLLTPEAWLMAAGKIVDAARASA